MATPQARIKAIFDALVNGVAPVPLIEKGVNALIGISSAIGIGGPTGEPFTNAQKAELALKQLRNYVKDCVRRDAERDAVAAASTSAAAQVDQDFNEAP